MVAAEVDRERAPVPVAVWAAALAVAALRALPYLATRVESAPPGLTFPPTGYNPKDFLQYVALIRETATTGAWLVANPFTTDPQSGRYLLLLQDVLGVVCRWTGASPFLVLELSRVPLLLALFAVLWRATAVVLERRDDRIVACWLVALAGGFDGLVDAGMAWAPEAVRAAVAQDLWQPMGWSAFASFHNPMWVAALALTIVAVVPIVRPGGPRGPADLVTLSLAEAALVLTHPYSAFVVVAVAVARPVVAWLFDVERPLAGSGRVALALAPVLVAGAALSHWQRADPVFRATSGNVIGPQALSVAWYPVTLGLVGVFAVAGWRRWVLDRHPAAPGMAAWTLAVVWLHTSTVLNGYHFAFHLWIPLCLAAAAPARAAFARALAPRGERWRAVALGVLLLQSPLVLTYRAVRDIEMHPEANDVAAAIDLLAALPPGNLLTTALIGNFVPAWTSHRVYVGHWFLTPDFLQRAQVAERIVRGQADPDDVRALVDAQRIRYILAPNDATPVLRDALGPRFDGVTAVGGAAVIVLREHAAEG